jgi:acyl dehydratase
MARQPAAVRRAYTQGVRDAVRRIRELAPAAGSKAHLRASERYGRSAGYLARSGRRGAERGGVARHAQFLDLENEGAAMIWLEEFAPGQKYVSAGRRVDAAAIRAFATEFDPQPFHLDDDSARGSFFGGLAASGWHTAALTMRLLVESGFRPAGGIIGSRADELKWPRPVRPGDELHVEAEVLEVRASNTRPGQGFLKCRTTTLNQNGEPVQILVMNLLVKART